MCNKTSIVETSSKMAKQVNTVLTSSPNHIKLQQNYRLTITENHLEAS